MSIESFTPESAPSGSIAMWPDTLSSIPDGWILCDGNNGTPNLLDQFAKSAPDNSDPGATGGNKSISISSSQMPQHNHTGNTGNISYHFHDIKSRILGDEVSDSLFRDVQGGFIGTHESTSNGGHNHSINTGPDTTGAGSSVENRPEYYKLAFIMRV